MLARAHLILFLLIFAAMPALSQVEPSASGGATTTEDDTQMMTPPPVSGIPYPDTSGAETRSNFLDASVGGSGGYVDNVLPGSTGTPVSTGTYSVLGDFALRRTTPRQEATIRYSPNFLFYEPVTALNTVDHSASGIFRERLSPHITLTLEDFFLRTSDVFAASYPFSAGGLTGSTQAPVQAVIAPFAEQMNDNANAVITYQFGRNGMVGGGGSYSNFDLPNPAQALGLDTSSGEGASAFFSRRLTGMQYAGIAYNYSRTVGSIPNVQFETQTHSLLPFYTIYFTHTFSASVSAGIERAEQTQAQTQPYSSWSPSVVVSTGWQGKRGNLAATYLHTITSGEGLYGGFHSDSANASGGWKIGRTWNGSVAISYTNVSQVSSLIGLTYNNGDTITASVSLVHSISEHLSMSIGYERLHENYTGITVITSNPDSDRAYGTITYVFRKPLGR